MDPWSSTYVCLIVVKQGFDCRSSGRNLAGKSWVSASVLACNRVAPLSLGNWHMFGIRHTGNQATSLQITEKKKMNKLFAIKLIQASGAQWMNIIDYFHSGFKIYFGWLLSFHIYLPWTFKWSRFTNTDMTLTKSFHPFVLLFPPFLLPVSLVSSKGEGLRLLSSVP